MLQKFRVKTFRVKKFRVKKFRIKKFRVKNFHVKKFRVKNFRIKKFRVKNFLIKKFRVKNFRIKKFRVKNNPQTNEHAFFSRANCGLITRGSKCKCVPLARIENRQADLRDYIASNRRRDSAIRGMRPIQAKTGTELENDRLLRNVNDRLNKAHDLQSELRIQFDVEKAKLSLQDAMWKKYK